MRKWVRKEVNHHVDDRHSFASYVIHVPNFTRFSEWIAKSKRIGSTPWVQFFYQKLCWSLEFFVWRTTTIWLQNLLVFNHPKDWFNLYTIVGRRSFRHLLFFGWHRWRWEIVGWREHPTPAFNPCSFLIGLFFRADRWLASGDSGCTNMEQTNHKWKEFFSEAMISL